MTNDPSLYEPCPKCGRQEGPFLSVVQGGNAVVVGCTACVIPENSAFNQDYPDNASIRLVNPEYVQRSPLPKVPMPPPDTLDQRDGNAETMS